MINMKKEDLRIIFLGTPEFAVESLDKLVEGGYNVVATVTMPDKIAGRGHHLLQSDVKKYALEKGLPVLQPTNLKDPAFVEELRSYNADLFIVIAFRMLPEVVWSMPRLGTFNLHASLQHLSTGLLSMATSRPVSLLSSSNTKSTQATFANNAPSTSTTMKTSVAFTIASCTSVPRWSYPQSTASSTALSRPNHNQKASSCRLQRFSRRLAKSSGTSLVNAFATSSEVYRPTLLHGPISVMPTIAFPPSKCLKQNSAMTCNLSSLLCRATSSAPRVAWL